MDGQENGKQTDRHVTNKMHIHMQKGARKEMKAGQVVGCAGPALSMPRERLF